MCFRPCFLPYDDFGYNNFPDGDNLIESRIGNNYTEMRIIARKTLKDYWEKVPTAKSNLEAWFAEASAADWQTPHDIKKLYGTASILRDGRVVFNICGNNHRLVVWINYEYHTIYIRFLGTHQEYDAIDAETI